MKIFFQIGLALVLSSFILSCVKKVIPVQPPIPVAPVDKDTADFTCATLPTLNPAHRDSISDNPNHLVANFKYSPSNPNLVVYCQYSGLGSYDIYSYNFFTRERHSLAKNIVRSYDINSQNWVVFDAVDDWNVYKIKANGDSLTQLTFDGNSFSPKWDYTETSIYCYNDYPKNQTVKISQHGDRLDSIAGGDFSQAFSKISDKRVYLRDYQGNSTQRALYIMDMSAKTETVILHGDNDILPYSMSFDSHDEFIYGNNDSVLVKINIAAKSFEVFKKNCANNGFSVCDIARGSSKLTCGWGRITYIRMHPGTVILTELRTFELDLNDLSGKPVPVKMY